METTTSTMNLPSVKHISNHFLPRIGFMSKTLPGILTSMLSALLALDGSAQAADGMSLHLQMEEGGSTTFSERLTIQDNGAMDQNQGDNSIDFDVTWGLYQVKGKFEQDTSNVFNMKLSDCTISRIAPGSPHNERLLITLLSGQYGPSGDSIIFGSAHVEGMGHGDGHMEVSASYQVWGPSNNGQFSNLGYTTKPEGQNPWNLNANLGTETFTGPLTYTAGYVNVLVSDVGDSMELKNSFEVDLRDRNETESERKLVPGPSQRWTRILGGNGHCYQAVAAENWIDWFSAEIYAEEMMGGHLATINSEAENDFVFKLIDSPQYWTSLFEGSWGPWLGGLQTPGAAEPDGGWGWVSGEPWSYEAWAENRPDNETGIEDRLHFFDPSDNTRSPYWNDAFAFEFLQGFVAECEGAYSDFLKGDINEDGVVDIEDFNQWQKYTNDIDQVLRSEERWFDPHMIAQGDVDGDNIISDNDYNSLHKIVFGVNPLTIDDFSQPMPRLEARDIDGTLPVRFGATVTGTMLGGERDVLQVLDGVENPGDGAYFEVSDGRAIFSQDASSMSNALLIYDGIDGDPVRTVASTGLNGGTDITLDGTLDGADVDVARNVLVLKIALLIFSGVDNASELVKEIPVTDTPVTVRFPFSELSASSGEGADLTKVTTLIVQLGALDSAIGPVYTEIERIIATSSQIPDDEREVLYEQMKNIIDSEVPSIDYPGDNPFDAEAADDFIIQNEPFRIGRFEWAAEWDPSPPPNSTANLTIFDDGGSVPDEILTTAQELPIVPSDEEPGIWSVTLPEPWELPPGTYWASIKANTPIGFEMLWKESSTAHGEPYTWRNPGGAFGTSCSDWTAGMDCLGEQPSIAFRIREVSGE